MSDERLLGGLTEEEIADIVVNTSGRVIHNEFGDLLVTRGGRHGSTITALTRLGTSRTPDALGTVTSTSRPASIKEALRMLDETANKAKSGD